MFVGLPTLFYMSISDMQYRKTDVSIGGEDMHHGEENMCCSSEYGRHFLTKEEKIKKLTEYKEYLDNESKGVSEAIEELNSK